MDTTFDIRTELPKRGKRGLTQADPAIVRGHRMVRPDRNTILFRNQA
jgi:hypothetical protein